MSQDSATKIVSSSKRRFFGLVTALYAGVGAIFVATPFIKSFQPSRRVRAVGAPLDVNISDIQPGALKVIQWRGRPIWVLRRTEKMMMSLSLVTDLLADPDSDQSKQPEYARNSHRSIEDEWLVVEGLCTHLGCSPVFRPDAAASDLGDDWQGGFFCPCHGSKFDLAGRVYKNMPAPTNLRIPPYSFVDSTTLLVGNDKRLS